MRYLTFVCLMLFVACASGQETAQSLDPKANCRCVLQCGDFDSAKVYACMVHDRPMACQHSDCSLLWSPAVGNIFTPEKP